MIEDESGTKGRERNRKFIEDCVKAIRDHIEKIINRKKLNCYKENCIYKNLTFDKFNKENI